jgi:hypothetical protein
MKLEEFANAVSFRFFGPSAGLVWYHRLNHRLARLGLSLEVLNTRLPADRREARPALRRLLSVPRMSTYAVAAIIDKAVSDMPAGTAFVNVGVWHGFSALSGIANNPDKKCVLIDNFSQFGGPREEFLARFAAHKSPNHEFHEMDYERYFAEVHRGPIGFYIYDGEHSYQNQLRGLEAAEPFFSDECVILVDDTNDDEPRRATLDFMNRTPGRYRLLFDRKTLLNGHPTFWNGVMIFARSSLPPAGVA